LPLYTRLRHLDIFPRFDGSLRNLGRYWGEISAMEMTAMTVKQNRDTRLVDKAKNGDREVT
jgi:hypothetical protein